MIDQDLYNKNIRLLKIVNEPLAQKMGMLTSLKEPLSSSKEELNEWFKGLELEKISVLYIYGLGSGEAYEIISPWLKENPNRWVVFLEDDLEAIRYFLGTPHASALLDDQQVDLQDISRATVERSIIRQITQDNMLRPTAITALPSHQNHKADAFILIRDLISFETSEQNTLYPELAKYGAYYFNNFYPNILSLPQSYNGKGLFNKFANIPAIICGAGPSLAKQIPLLKTLGQKALIFAPSSTQNILTSHGIWPHFGIAIDPMAETYHRQYMQRGFETPVFYQNRVYHETLSAIQGPKIFMPSSSFYLIEDWFEEQLGLPAIEVEEGNSSVNTALNYARLLGCNPIIFVGLELSKSTDEHYASGVEKHPLFPPDASIKTHLGNPVIVKDIHGNPVSSYWTWIAEANWIDRFSRLYPELRLINATQAGIGLFSVPNQSLEEVVEEHLKETYDLDTLIHTSLQAAGLMPVTTDQLKDCLERFSQSLRHCLEICSQIIKSLSVPDEQWIEHEMDLRKELGYKHLLIQMDEFFLKFNAKDRRLVSRIKDTQLALFKQQYLDLLRYRFLIQATNLNLHMIENTLKKQTTESVPDKDYSNDHLLKGMKTYRYPSGSVYSIQTYLDDLREGIHLYYYPNGILKSEISYHQGQLDGTTKLYYPDGKLKRELYFANGERNGSDTHWYPNGQIYIKVDYENNTAKHASCWQENGTLAKDIDL